MHIIKRSTFLSVEGWPKAVNSEGGTFYVLLIWDVLRSSYKHALEEPSPCLLEENCFVLVEDNILK